MAVQPENRLVTGWHRIMEAIRAKDRATAKKIVRKMEERARRRAMEKTVETATPLRAIGKVGRPTKDSRKGDKAENVTFNTDRGNSSTYRLGKIKRDHPELAKRIMAGEFKSVSEAERAAGLRPPLLTDYEKAQRAFWRLTEEEQERFREKGGNGSNQHAGANTQNCTFATPTQAKYASEIGVSRKTVNDWESDAKILD